MVGLMQTGNLDAGLLTAGGLCEIDRSALALKADPRKALSESSAGYWGGDHYVTTTKGNRTCVTDRIEATSPLGRGYLLGSLTVWTQTHPGSSAIKGPTATSIVLTSCIG